MEKKTESAIFQVCGENERSVENAIAWIQDTIKMEQGLYTSEEEHIKDFAEKEYQELTKLQKNLNIAIYLDTERPLIEVSGISREVEQARQAIEKMMKTVRLTKEQEFRADCISEVVAWQYNDNNTIHHFDKITNLQLEDARRKNIKTVSVQINRQKYTVDLKTYVATDAKGHSLPVQRLTKSNSESNFHTFYPVFYSLGLALFCIDIKTVFKSMKFKEPLWNEIENLVSELKDLTLRVGIRHGRAQQTECDHLSVNTNQTLHFYGLQPSQCQSFWGR